MIDVVTINLKIERYRSQKSLKRRKTAKKSEINFIGLTFMVFKIVIDVDVNIQDICFYTPEPVPVSAIVYIGYSGTNKPFWHNRYRFP